MAVKIFISQIFLVILLHICEGDRIKEKIYHEMKGLGTCFRRLNATHEVGCSSGRSGNVGVVHYIVDDKDLDWLVNDGPHAPYVALIHTENFKTSTVTKLTASGKVNGLIILDGNQTLQQKPFSPDSTCPNDNLGLYTNNSAYRQCKKVAWNPDGTDMLFQRFDFPVFVMLKQDEVDYIINDCFKKFNQPKKDGSPRKYPLCAAELKDIMDASVDTVTCRRRTLHITNLNPDHYCDPLGDQNVFSTLKFLNKTEKRPEKSIIIAAARLDASSLFENIYPGADSVISGVVALLAAAEVIGKVKNDLNKTDKDIMFTFFQGEAYGYIGSSRMVYDMENDVFPRKPKKDVEEASNINMSHILHFIEVNQVGLRDKQSLWIHSDPISMRNNKETKNGVNLLTSTLKSAAKAAGLAVTDTTGDQPLPPASLQRFLRKSQEISGIVLTDHQADYSNKYYNSRFDVRKNINVDYPSTLNDSEKYDYVTKQATQLTKVATTLANTLYELVTNTTHANLSANENTVTHLLYCYLYSPKCDLFNTTIDVANAKGLEKLKGPFPLYVSVDSSKNPVTKLTRLVLAYFTGDHLDNMTEKTCTQPKNDLTYNYIWMQGPEVEKEGKIVREPVCVRTLSDMSEAVSPAFKINNYDWSSGEYSTWTESIWPSNAMSLRVFLLPSEQQETIILAVGVILFLISMLLVYFIDARAHILFGTDRTQAYMS